MNSRDELQRAYLDTTFVAFALDSEIRIRVGQQNTALNDLLRKHGASTWAFITAYNPGSVLLDSSENEQRQKQLESDLRACGYVLILGAGEPGTNDSPAERSVLVLGMERGEAEGFGQKYEQNAIIFGTEKGFPELLWIQ